MSIDISIKKRCVEMVENGIPARQIYNDYFKQVSGSEQSLESFKHTLRKWKHKTFADDDTLYAGTYGEFIAHDATVQVNGNGQIIQAWIKQKADEQKQFEQIIEAIKENVQPEYTDIRNEKDAYGMLEISLFDMHFPLNYYGDTQNELLKIINKQHYDEINLTIGQDLFHNDDIRGRTASGKPIENVDMQKAWNMAKVFWYRVIRHSLENANRVKLRYSKGNHDESFAWTFVQMLKEAFPDLTIDDSFKQRKYIYWNGCFIGITHGHETKSQNNELRGQFTIEFAKSKVREIRCGHLHHEKEADIYGVMIRRLSSGANDSGWEDDEGYIGTHKRFMIFEYEPEKLRAIYYV